MSDETRRLDEARDPRTPWKKWGPYLSERQWGTVREDYSGGGNAWEYFSHDQARSRAYRWGEDGLAGISDDHQLLCFALALWNGADPILKERLFGLTNSEGNHGEDVKEYYFYLDSTPTHSYMKYLYKYPQAAFPYGELVAKNRARGRHEHEFALIDTGVFDSDRYSNWRGPVNLYFFYGNEFTVECPTGSGVRMTLFEVAREIARRLTQTFLRDEHRRRPVYGATHKFQTDPNWQDLILFYEYFHGDNGAGIGANHQTGWTGLVAGLIQLLGSADAESMLATGGAGAAVYRPPVSALAPT